MEHEQFMKYARSLGVWRKAELKSAKANVKTPADFPEIFSKQCFVSKNRGNETIPLKERLDKQQLDNYLANQKVTQPTVEDKTLDIAYEENITTIAIMSAEEAYEFYQNIYNEVGGKQTVQNIKDYSDLAKGSFEAYTTAKGLGSLGVQAYTKSINGYDWVIIKGYRKYEKTIMAGNKWRANNPSVIKMGLGLNDLKGAARFVKFNVAIEIVFAVGINAADYVSRDEATLSEFVGNSAGDMVKGLATLAGAAVVTTVILPVSATVLLTGLVFAVASFAIGSGLDALDEEHGYSTSFTNAVKDLWQ